jgi:hypothetical protein
MHNIKNLSPALKIWSSKVIAVRLAPAVIIRTCFIACKSHIRTSHVERICNKWKRAHCNLRSLCDFYFYEYLRESSSKCSYSTWNNSWLLHLSNASAIKSLDSLKVPAQMTKPNYLPGMFNFTAFHLLWEQIRWMSKECEPTGTCC